jgi:adenylate cyclase
LREQWVAQCEDFRGVDLGIAVTSGTVFLGNIGSARRLDYTVIGNEVNIAQRLATESSSCRIYTTDAVRREIDGLFEITELGEMQLRGLEKKIRVFCVNDEQ